MNITANKWRVAAAIVILVLGAGTVCLASDVTQNFAAQNKNADEDRGEYVIGAQNLLHIRVFEEGSLQQTFRVDDLGYITYPLLGRVSLVGKTISEAESLLEAGLREGYLINPQVSIFVLEHSRFSIMGEVRSPGTYEILGQITLVEAISRAGGFTPIADEKNVNILRKSGEGVVQKISVNASKIIEGDVSTRNREISGGDVIVVPKRFF